MPVAGHRYCTASVTLQRTRAQRHGQGGLKRLWPPALRGGPLVRRKDCSVPVGRTGLRCRWQKQPPRHRAVDGQRARIPRPVAGKTMLGQTGMRPALVELGKAHRMPPRMAARPSNTLRGLRYRRSRPPDTHDNTCAPCRLTRAESPLGRHIRTQGKTLKTDGFQTRRRPCAERQPLRSSANCWAASKSRSPL